MATSYSKKSLELTKYFLDSVSATSKYLQARWETQAFYMTPLCAAVYPLYFRNSSIWDALNVLFAEEKFIGAEFLVRPLFEGVTKFDWCMLDLESRALRFRLTTMESTVEYEKLRYSDRVGERDSTLIEAIDALKKKGFKKLPSMEQICKELRGTYGDKWYAFYKYFSKIVHVEYENWVEYDIASSKATVEELALHNLVRSINCRSLSAFLQMRNIVLMGKLFEPMRYENQSNLEDIWSALFYSLLDDER